MQALILKVPGNPGRTIGQGDSGSSTDSDNYHGLERWRKMYPEEKWLDMMFGLGEREKHPIEPKLSRKRVGPRGNLIK